MATPRISLGLAQVGVSTALAYLVAPRQSLGFALNLRYQELALEGADVFAVISDDRKHFSNQGKDGTLGVGFTLGWLGELSPEVLGALSYRSKTWSQRSKEYAGLLPDRGRFDLPAIYGGGLSWEFVPGWMAAAEFQRVMYASELATGNEFRQLLGGYSYGTQNVPESQTLFGTLAPSFAQRHYTTGGTLRLSAAWEISAYAAFTPKAVLHGRDSIPPLAGGGEVDFKDYQHFAGFSFGRTFGN